LTVEEQQTTDASSAESTPEEPGTETVTSAPEAAATEAAPVEAAPASDDMAAETAPDAGSDITAGESAGSDESGTEPMATVEPDLAVVNDAAPVEGAAPDATSEPLEPVAPVNVAEPAEGPAEPVADAAPEGSVAAAGDATTDGPAPAADVATEEAAPAAALPAAHAAVAAEPDRPEPTTMEELLAQQSGDIPSLKHGDVVEGTIVRIDKDEMLVDVGAKSEGVVSNRELYGRNAETQPELSVGDTVLVYVLQPESTDGHAVLSLRRAGLERKWRSMQEQFDAGDIIEAPVIDHNKGGLIVDCGIRGFVPISQIVDFPRRPQNDQPRDAAQEIAEKLQPYVGRRLRLKILEVNRKANRLILSEKVALYEERREKRDELFSSLQVGQQVKGTVRSIAPFGIFIDLGGIDGLVHKSELSWNKVNSPEGAYEVGDEVEAEVIDINHERGRISLSIRRMQPDPWQSTVGDLKVGDLVDGTVTKIVNFGAFVRVKDGLEGLIHISELSHQRVAHPGDVVHEGQTLKLKVISLDSERHRLGLSLKQAEEAPARPPRERRVRTERSAYDRSQAIQEPEGGIDNTLAAAFAQVRQQIAEQDAAEAGGADEVVSEASVTDEVSAATGLDVPAAELDETGTEAAAADVATAAPGAEVEVGEAIEDLTAEPEAAEAVAEPEAAEAAAEPAAAEPAADAAEAAREADITPEADITATTDEVAASVEDEAAAAAEDAMTAAGDDVAVDEPVEGADETAPAKA
jgi:small subunit ribosomal protein S1